MLSPLVITLLILVVAAILLLSDRVRADLVALLVVVALGVTGVLTPREAFSGFSSAAAVIMAAVFVLVAGLQVVKPGTTEPDADLATKVNVACYHRGLLMFAPVGVAGECLKVAPPLTIPEEMLAESLQVFEEACDAVLGV